MGVREILAGKAVVEIGVRNKLAAGLASVRKKLAAFGSTVRTIGAGAAAGGGMLAAGSAALFTPLLAAAKSFVAFGDNIQKMAIRTGLATETLSELGFAAEQSGTDLATVEKSIGRMQRTITDAGDGLAGAGDALAALGLNVASLQSMAPETQFETIAAAIASIEDPTERAARAMQIFGRGGAELMPLITSDIRALRAEAKALGITLSQDDADAAANLGDALNRVARTAKAAWTKVGAAVAPAFTAAANVIAKVVAGVTAWIDKNRGLFVGLLAVAGVVGTLAGALTTAGFAMIGIGAAISALAPLLAIAFSPLGAGIAALVGLAAAAYYFRDSLAALLSPLLPTFAALRDLVTNFASIFSETFGGVVAALASGDLATAGQIAFAGLRAAFWQGVADLGGVVSSLLDLLTGWIPGLDSVRDYAAATFASIGKSILAGRWDLAAAIAWEKIKLVVAQGWSAINQIFIVGRYAIRSVWDGFVAGLTTAWRSAYFGIAQGFVWIANQALAVLKGLVPAIRALGFEDMANSISSMSVDGIAGTLSQMQNEAAQRDAAAAAARNRARDEQMRAAMEADAAAVKSARERVAALEAEADQAAEASGNITLSDKAAAARAELAKAIADANANAGKQSTAPEALAQLADASARGQESTRRLASSGTFSAAGAALLGLGTDKPGAETANNTRTLVALTRKLVAKPTPQFGS